MKRYISSLLFLAAAMLWGFAFAAQKQISVLPLMSIGSMRGIMAGSFLFAIIPLMDKVQKNGRELISRRGLDFNKTELIGGVLCGVVLAVASSLQQLGIGDGDDVGKAAFISALYVLIVPIISMLGGKRSPFNVWIGVGIAILGFYLLCVDGDLRVAPADLVVLVSATIYALHIIVIDRFSPRCDGVRMSCIQFLTLFVLLTPISLITDGIQSVESILPVLPSLLYFGICSGGLGYTLQIIGQQDADPAVASIILSLESVFGAIGGAIFLHEEMMLREYIGCGVVFIAIIIAQLDFKAIIKKQKNRSPKERT